jgi:hypothetical protein
LVEFGFNFFVTCAELSIGSGKLGILLLKVKQSFFLAYTRAPTVKVQVLSELHGGLLLSDKEFKVCLGTLCEHRLFLSDCSLECRNFALNLSISFPVLLPVVEALRERLIRCFIFVFFRFVRCDRSRVSDIL